MRAYGKTDTGIIRQNNEDSIFVSNDAVGVFPNLYVVADGMGGHLAGEFASGMAISGMCAYAETSGEKELKDALKAAVAFANGEIFKLALKDSEKRGMGTTVTAMVVIGSRAIIVNVGDSRAYLLSPSGITQLTTDHSFVQELIDAGKITAREASTHPRKNIITRALGTREHVECDLFERELNEGESVLLCSDGLTNMLDDGEIFDMWKDGNNMATIVDTLVNRANEKGGADNISVVICENTDEV